MSTQELHALEPMKDFETEQLLGSNGIDIREVSQEDHMGNPDLQPMPKNLQLMSKTRMSCGCITDFRVSARYQ